MKQFFQSTLSVAMFVLFVPLQSMTDLSKIDKGYMSFVMAVGQRPVAYVEEDIQQNLLTLYKHYSDHRWTDLYDCLYQDMQEGANVVLHEQMVKVVDECLDFFQQQEGKNSLWKQELVDIKVSLQDYKQFLTLERSMVDASSLLATKKKCCPVPAQRCIDISPYLPFLPTGPIVPVTSNFFYAYRQDLTTFVLQTTPQQIPFTAVGQNDGNWSFTSTTDFTALASGVFLISAMITYQHNDIDQGQPPVFLYLQPTLDNNIIPFASVFYRDDFSNAGDVYNNTFQMEAIFIVPVTAGQVLRFQDQISVLDPVFVRIAAPSAGSSSPVNGSVTIVRIQ